jgi:single-strand DNA-binding protein
MNSINLIGRMTATPELKQTTTGKAVCNFDIAVDRPRQKDVTDFFTVVAWNGTAEYVCKYATKGENLAVCGVLTTRAYEDRDGNKRKVYEILADTVHVIFGKKSDNSEPNGNAAPSFVPFNPQPAPAKQTSFEELQNDDDLPF